MTLKTRRRPVSSDKRFRKISGSGDHGTPERWQHSGFTLELTDRAGVLAVRAMEEHVLDILTLKNQIGDSQTAAGMRLRADFLAAAIVAHVTSGYTQSASVRACFHPERQRSEKEEAAYARWRAAVKELGLDQRRAVISTVCFDESPQPRDLPSLQEGLDKLAAWYKMGARSNDSAKRPPC